MENTYSSIQKNLGIVWKTRRREYEADVMREGERNLSFYQKSISSFVASTLTNLAVTPLDVVKVRLQAQEKINPIPIHTITISNNKNTNSNINLINNKNNNIDLNNCNNKLNNNSNNNNLINKCNKITHLGNNNNISSKLNRPPTMHITNTLEPHTQPRFTSTWNTFRTIIRTEGVSSLWAGIWPTLLISIPITILYFPLYDKVKYYLGYDEQDPSSSYIPPLAGVMCRTSVVILFNPLELYRTKLQSTPLTLTQLLEVSKVSFQRSGPSFLFHGTFAALLRDVPFSAIYWFLYEKIKSKRIEKKKTSQSQSIDTLIAGAVAGSVAAAVTVPFDVIKTHWQIELGSQNITTFSSFQMIKRLAMQKGLRGLYAGITPRLIRVAPACAIMITAYESFKAFFIKYNIVALESL